MSFILDALKKSDKERQQRATPALQSVYAAPEPRPVNRRMWPSLLVLALLINAGLLVWWLQPWRNPTPSTPAQETRGQEAPAPAGTPVAKAPAGEQLAAASSIKTPPPPEASAVKTNPEPVKNVPIPPTIPAPAKSEANTPPAPIAAAAPVLPAPPATPTAAVQGKSAPASPPQVAPPRDRAPARPDVKKPAESAGGDSRRASFSRQAPPANRKDATAGLEGRTSSLPAAKAGRAQNELEALVGKQIPLNLEGGAAVDTARKPAREAKPVAPQPPEPKSSVPQYDDLPPKIRDELPNLSFSMFIYSPDPASRMVGIKGRVVREGQELAPGLKVESILPDGVILNYRGQLFLKR